EKMQNIHDYARQRINLQSLRSKIRYDRKARRIFFEVGQDVWFFNPRRGIGR
ncbi:hypothetical protein EAG_12256, partial [Camponotus floridanus]